MVSRRDALRLGAAGLASLVGCAGSPSTGSPTPTPAPIPSDAATPDPTDRVSSEPTDSPTPVPLENWESDWALHPDYEHVLGLDVAGGSLYATLSDERGPSAVSAVDPSAPAMEWETELEGEAVGGSAAGSRPIARDGWGVTVADDAVYAVTGRADSYEWTALSALDRASGERRWSVRRDRELTVHGVVSGLVVATGREFFEPDSAHDVPEEPLTSVVYCIAAADGDVRWTASFDGVVDVGVADDGVYIAAGQQLVGLGLDGSRRFSYDGGSHEGRAVRAVRGRVYYLTDRGDRSVIHGVDPDGDRAWQTTQPVHEVLLDGDRLYAGGEAVLALEPDGTIAWRDTSGYGQWLLLGPDGDMLFTRAGRGQDRATAYRTSDGTRRWTYRPPDLSSRDAWPVAVTTDTAVVEGITAEDADDPFTTLYRVDRQRGRGTRSVAVEPVFDVESVDGTVVVAGSSILALEP